MTADHAAVLAHGLGGSSDLPVPYMYAMVGAAWALTFTFALIAFAWLLTLVPAEHAGRAYAAYGGVYIVASLLWLWLAEGHAPDRWDLIGGALALVSAGIILFAPRG